MKVDGTVPPTSQPLCNPCTHDRLRQSDRHVKQPVWSIRITKIIEACIVKFTGVWKDGTFRRCDCELWRLCTSTYACLYGSLYKHYAEPTPRVSDLILWYFSVRRASTPAYLSVSKCGINISCSKWPPLRIDLVSLFELLA